MSESKIFDTRLLAGLKAAERYKARLNNKYDIVRVLSIGLDRVQIYGQTETRAK